MEQNGEETDKMNVWKKARDQSKPEVVEVILVILYLNEGRI
ncbi:hypothetical protein RchiOBHm_Chr2g0118081 [Rosa chinensis]|uniref:Uncharacterized protein n=1 Tax=Rosa chinensis TaxID=74649 RepID=A0A2P6RRN4_ROSCH|nr:hypothetical protein RchiOBHm_Chr2g0118081 [Rosa chinensis]